MTISEQVETLLATHWYSEVDGCFHPCTVTDGINAQFDAMAAEHVKALEGIEARRRKALRLAGEVGNDRVGDVWQSDSTAMKTKPPRLPLWT